MVSQCPLWQNSYTSWKKSYNISEQGSYDLDYKLLIAIEIDYTKLTKVNGQAFSGKVEMVSVNWKLHQQQFLAKSNFLISGNMDLSEFDA